MEKEVKQVLNEEATADYLEEKYKDYVISNGRDPRSIRSFMKSLNMDSKLFFQHFPSFRAIRSSIWSGYIEETIEAIINDKVYSDYSARERLLAFYYTLIELLKKDRSYVNQTIKNISKGRNEPWFLKAPRRKFISYVQEIVSEAIANKEIVNRYLISDFYKNALVQQLIFVIGFWLRDDSKDFERTDAAIDKAVNLSFELMDRGPLDAMFDFAKFLYQSRK